MCFGAPADKFAIVPGTGRHVSLIGDSDAQMLIPTFMEIAQREHLTRSLVVRGGCPWQRHVCTRVFGSAQAAQCKKLKEDA